MTGLSAVKRSTKCGLVHAVRVDGGREQGHQVDDVDHAHLQLGDMLCAATRPPPPSPSSECRRRRPAPRPARSPSSLLAHSQIDAPRAQCSIGLVHGQVLQLRLLVITIRLT